MAKNRKLHASVKRLNHNLWCQISVNSQMLQQTCVYLTFHMLCNGKQCCRDLTCKLLKQILHPEIEKKDAV